MKNIRFYNFSTNKSKEYSFVLFGFNIWSFYYQDRFGWVRFFTYFGFKWKDLNHYDLTFSERNNKTKWFFRIKNWYIRGFNK